MKVEPGEYNPATTRLSKGTLGWSFIFCHALFDNLPANKFGSYAGEETIATTPPVSTSINTTAPVSGGTYLDLESFNIMVSPILICAFNASFLVIAS